MRRGERGGEGWRRVGGTTDERKRDRDGVGKSGGERGEEDASKRQ